MRVFNINRQNLKLFIMEIHNYASWNQLVYYVSSVYHATRKFKPGEPGQLQEKIRRTAISLSVDFNTCYPDDDFQGGKARIYPILSSISVLETYLQLAKKYKLLKDTSVLDEKLAEVKEILNRYLEEE